jgi:hypothetical protein
VVKRAVALGIVLLAAAALVVGAGRDGGGGPLAASFDAHTVRRGDDALRLAVARGRLAPLRARHVDLMSQQVMVQPEELRRYGAVTCLLHHDALGKGAAPSASSTRTIACQRTSAGLSVTANELSPSLEADPQRVARLVQQAFEELR